MTQTQAHKAVLAFLDQFVGRGAADDVLDLRARLAEDPATQARLIGELPSDDLGEREGYDAMRRFFAVEHERGDSEPIPGDGPGLNELLSWTGWEDWADNQTTNDPAQWQDWLRAARSITAP